MSNKTARFRMNGEQLKQLLTGNIVKIEATDEVTVEFFLQDIGIDLVDDICRESVVEVKKNLMGH